MQKFLLSSPRSWHKPLVLSAVPKNGDPFEDSLVLSADLPINYWGQIYRLLGDVLAQYKVFRSEGRIVLSLSVKTKIAVPCSRCLEDATADVEGGLKYIFSLRHDEAKNSQESEPEDNGDEEIITLDSWENEIDLAEYIWEVLITSLPSTVLCREDCRGLCPICGANLNKGKCSCREQANDPRFEILKNFIRN